MATQAHAGLSLIMFLSSICSWLQDEVNTVTIKYTNKLFVFIHSIINDILRFFFHPVDS